MGLYICCFNNLYKLVAKYLPLGMPKTNNRVGNNY